MKKNETASYKVNNVDLAGSGLPPRGESKHLKPLQKPSILSRQGISTAVPFTPGQQNILSNDNKFLPKEKNLFLSGNSVNKSSNTNSVSSLPKPPGPG